jgi:hypothetical protein
VKVSAVTKTDEPSGKDIHDNSPAERKGRMERSEVVPLCSFIDFWTKGEAVK